MRKKQLTEKEKEKKAIEEALTLSLSKNLVARKYCIENGLTIYPACQSNGKIALFVQHKEKFKRFNNVLYSQSTVEEVLIYTAEIIKGYEKYYINRPERYNKVI